MIKKLLLASSVLSLGLAANAAEKEAYIIKDGKFVNCEFVPSAEDVEESYEIEQSKNAAGEAMVKVKNPAKNWKAGLLYLSEPVDLNETWVLEVEYFFEKDMELTGPCAKHEGWTFDLMADSTAFEDGTSWKCDKTQIEYRIAHVSIDARGRDFFDAKGELDNHGVGELRTVRQYVYSSPFLPKTVAERGDANKVHAIFLTMFNEAGAELVGYIKNLKFVSDGTKPFYAERFTVLNGEGTIHSGSVESFLYGKITETGVDALDFENFAPVNPTKTYGQQALVSNSGDGFYAEVPTDRMYLEKNDQAEAEFYDTEYGFLPYLVAQTTDYTSSLGRTDDDGNVCDAEMRIPFGKNIVKKNISIQMRLGHNGGQTGDLTPYATYKKKSSDSDHFPVKYRFEKGDAKTIEAATEWIDFRPTYTKGGDDYVDSIPTMMYTVYGDVEVPAGDYTHINIRYIPNDVISYMFADLRLTGDLNAWPKAAKDYVLGADFAGYKIPVSLAPGTDVKNVVAKGEVSIYPNPASDVITVANEGVKSVAVYTVAGSLVASSESNTVNVASLANGIYVVKANTEAGVITGQIIKK